MTDLDRPRKKSPIAGDGSFGKKTPAARVSPPTTRGPIAPVAMIALGFVLLAIVSFWLLRRPPPPATEALTTSSASSASGAKTAAQPAAPPAATPEPAPAPVEPPAPSPVASGAAAPSAADSASAAKSELRAALTAARPRLLACVERALKEDPAAGGTLQLELDVDATGKVESAKVTGGRPPALRACVQRVATSLAFAKSDGPRRIFLPLALNEP
jgi:pyruvate/2-oxoglutarate dehydrogenase complex dihydrolipoamide acyltransferase (E2) component